VDIRFGLDVVEKILLLCGIEGQCPAQEARSLVTVLTVNIAAMFTAN
jgi:hypothetical protein